VSHANHAWNLKTLVAHVILLKKGGGVKRNRGNYFVYAKYIPARIQ
jgi:hypothetical protein